MHNHHIKKIKKHFILINIILMMFLFGISFWLIKSGLKNYLSIKYDINKQNITVNSSSFFFKYSHPIKFSFANEKTNSIPILLYHGVISENDGNNVTLDNFKKQMVALKNEGWRTTSLEDYFKFIKGEIELPAKSFLLTFDDGRKDSYYPVDPILKALNYKAVIFIIAQEIKSMKHGYYLSDKELAYMVHSKRWEIQPHTFAGHGLVEIDESGNQGHFYSNKKWLKESGRLETNDEFNERIRNDFLLAKEKISSEFNTNIIGFAFPFGDYGQESINFPEAKDYVLKNAKEVYPLSFYQFRADGLSFNYQDKDAFMAKRISVKPEWDGDYLLGELEKGRAKNLPFQDNFETDKGWLSTWGEKEILERSLIMKSHSETTGSSVFLDGTRLWKEDAFEAKVDWKKGSNVLLLARYRDDNNYVACNFGQNIARVESRINGESEILKEEKMIPDISKNNLNLGIRVYDRKIQCLLDNKIIIEVEKNDNYLEDGGIGFKTWDKEVGNSELFIHEVSVTENSWENKEKYVQPELADEDKNKKAEEKIIEKKNLPFVALPVSLEQGWKKSWGELNFSNDGMIMKPAVSGTGGLVFLEGAEEWTNYSFVSMINWVNGSNLVILSRFRDGSNYLAFNVGEEFIRLEKYVNGKSKIIKEVPNDLKLNKSDIMVKINVTGNRVACFIGDKLILEDSNDISELSQGGIGFKVWDKKLNNSEIIVKQVEVLER